MSYSSSYYPRSYAYTKPNPPIGATSSSNSGTTHPTTGDTRPSTLNLTSSASSTKPTYSLNPSKPSRYTPLPPSTNQTPAKSSSYTSLPAAASSIATSAAAPGSLFASNYATGYGRKPPPQHQEVITVPQRSSSNLGYGRDYRDRDSGHVPYYQTQMTNYRVDSGLGGQSGSSHPPLNVTTSHAHAPPPAGVSMSKSSHCITDSIADVFCLSCPPAEFKFSDAYRAKTLPRTGKENERLIGFATLPEQVHRKSVKKGFDFTLMTVGESGLGKSTLINSLFMADFYQNRKIPSVNDQIKRTTTIQKHQTEIEERGVKLRLTLVDTPGFGDAINCENSWKACTDFIDDQFQQYFLAESGLNRRHIQDTRVHSLLYFVPPYGRGLRALDIQAMKHLQTRVNVIPVIGKADTLTPTEVKKLKEQILEDLRLNQIQIYQFPECDEEEDEDFKRQDRDLKASIPFAVSSSDTFVEIAGRKVRGRVYPWGIVEVENPTHSDFSKLRSMLIQSHMHDLKETTQDLHYENFRAKKIAQISAGNNNTKERSKLRRDSPPEDAPQELLIQKEAEIKRMQQMISRMEAKLKAAGKPSSRESTSSIDI